MPFHKIVAFIAIVSVLTLKAASEADDGQKFKRGLTPGCTGSKQVFRPTSCFDYLLKGASKCGIYRLYDNAGNRFPAYCDLKSEPGTAWTLVMSWSVKYRTVPAFQYTPFKYDAPVNENAHNWILYRQSLARMRSVQGNSTHWRATCSYPTHGVDFTDYIRGAFKDFSIVDYGDQNKCKKVEYINIRGHIGIQKTVPFWQGGSARGGFLHTDSSFQNACEFQPNAHSVVNEDNFGLYLTSNPEFRCTQGIDSTTQWWFGAHF